MVATIVSYSTLRHLSDVIDFVRGIGNNPLHWKVISFHLVTIFGLICNGSHCSTD